MRAVATRPRVDNTLLWGTVIFLTIAVLGLAYVKWFPYWNKAHVAAATHAIGTSIVHGKAAAPPAVSLQAGWQYSLAYFKAVWQAVVLALILGATVQVFVPREWLRKLIGAHNAKSAAIAGALSLGGMMCTCCSAPIVLGLRKQHASTGSALAFFLGNPLLNPATAVFIGFVLGWQFTALRIVAGVATIAVVVWLADRMNAQLPDDDAPTFEPAAIEAADRTPGKLFVAWLRELGNEIVAILPGYVAIVFLFGMARAWLFPPTLVLHGGLGTTALLSIIGTAFVIPTAGEVPIVQALAHQGADIGAQAALLLTLPAISIPSIFIVRKAFPAKVLAMTLGVVAVAGILTGVAATLLHI